MVRPVLGDPPMTTALASPLLGRPGAVSGEGVDAPVAAHYGDPMREQRLLVERLAAVDLSHRPVLTITGADRISWLHSLTTQHLNRYLSSTEHGHTLPRSVLFFCRAVPECRSELPARRGAENLLS